MFHCNSETFMFAVDIGVLPVPCVFLVNLVLSLDPS